MSSVIVLEKACPNCEYIGFTYFSNHCKSLYVCRRCHQRIYEKNVSDKYKCPCEVCASMCLGLPGFSVIRKLVQETPALKIIRRVDDYR